jgi:hypothetical protein
MINKHALILKHNCGINKINPKRRDKPFSYVIEYKAGIEPKKIDILLCFEKHRIHEGLRFLPFLLYFLNEEPLRKHDLKLSLKLLFSPEMKPNSHVSKRL